MVSTQTIKKLTLASQNKCAFTDCDEPIYDIKFDSIVGQICHIRGKSEGSPRNDPTFTKDMLDEYDNLILLCGKHHKIIDDHPDQFPVETVTEMKRLHESEDSSVDELDEEVINRLIEESDLIVSINNSQIGTVFNVSSTNQKGGITAGVVNVGSTKRTLNLAKKQYLLDELKSLTPRNMIISSLMGDMESISLAEEFKLLFLEMGWTIVGVNQVVSMRPIIGIELRFKENTAEIERIALALMKVGFKTEGHRNPDYDFALVVGGNLE